MITNIERFAQQMSGRKTRTGYPYLIDYCCLLALICLAAGALLAGSGESGSDLWSTMNTAFLNFRSYWLGW
jgi:hypothetical protein